MIKPINNFPYQYKKVNLPKGLIYNVSNKNLYNLVDTKNGVKVGKMFAYVDKDYHLLYKKFPYLDVFYIDLLEIKKTERNKGWGKYLIDFVKKESYSKKCEGRVTLEAYNPDKPPHLFYKKLGFQTAFKEENQEMDECIKLGKNFRICDILPMFLPENKY